MEFIIPFIIFVVLIVLCIIALDIARTLRKLAFIQDRMMHTDIAIQMSMDALRRDWNLLAQYLYGLDLPLLLLAQRERERGNK